MYTKRRLLFETVLILHIIAFAILVILAKDNPYFKIDLQISQIVQSINIPGFESLMVLVTTMGNAIWHIILAGVSVLVIYKIWSKQDALALFLSSTGAYFISIVLKTLIARPRPDPNLIHQFSTFSKADSFPSGHVLNFIGLYGFLFFLTYLKLKPGRLRVVLLTVFAGLIFLVGLSRIYLGAHWFSDVLGAYLIGMIWLYVMIRLYQRFFSK